MYGFDLPFEASLHRSRHANHGLSTDHAKTRSDKRPKVHDPALNHVGLWIDDLPAAVEWLEANGVRFTPGGIRAGAAGHDVCFVHPKGNEASPIGGAGVLIELVQAPADVIDAFRRLAGA